MSYLGNAPARSFISFERQVFTIVNSQTAYALSHSVANENDIRLVVNNVVQEPGSGKAYTATGTALTLSAALTNGTDEMYCVFLGRATATSAPGAGSIGTAQLASDAVTLAKMAPGTDGNIISYDASGNPVAVATGNDGQVLTSAGAGAPPVFETPASAANTPAWLVRANTNQTLNDSTATGLAFGTEYYDTANGFASDKFTVPSGQDGKYQIYYNVNGYDAGGSLKRMVVYLYLNGSSVAEFTDDFGNNVMYRINLGGRIALDLSAGNYLQIYALLDTADGSTAAVVGSSEAHTYFGGYKLIE